MAYEMKPDTGSLFKNDRKEKDTHADYRGSLNVGGVEYWIDAWLNESANGTKYMGLKVKPKEARNEAPTRRQPAAADLDDDVPF